MKLTYENLNKLEYRDGKFIERTKKGTRVFTIKKCIGCGDEALIRNGNVGYCSNECFLIHDNPGHLSCAAKDDKAELDEIELRIEEIIDYWG